MTSRIGYEEAEQEEEAGVAREIRPEWGQNCKGKYGRWLGIVYIDEIDINAEMMEKGHSVKYEEQLYQTSCGVEGYLRKATP